jgi:uncharacterized membrane protein YhhN
MMLALTIVCAAACLLLIAAEYAKWKRVRIVAKVIASLAFFAIGLRGIEISDPNPLGSYYAQIILAGLAFGALGDVFLLGSGKGAFLGGLVAFLIGHLAYTAAFALRVEDGSWTGAGWYALIPIVVGLLALKILWPRLGDMKVPVLGYVTVIVLMVIAAITAYRTHAVPDPQRTRLLVGAVLFFISDLAVARDKFVAPSFSNKAWGLPTYYAAQLFIAWSLVGL